MLKILPFAGYAVALVTLIALIAAGIWADSHIAADRVPMQWRLDGEPTWYAGRQIGLWLPVIISTFVLSTQLYAARRGARPSRWRRRATPSRSRCASSCWPCTSGTSARS